MSDKTADQQAQTEQPTTSNDAGQKTADAEGNANSGDIKATPVGQPGPKVLQSHFKGMPKNWEKNRQAKKDDDNPA